MSTAKLGTPIFVPRPRALGGGDKLTLEYRLLRWLDDGVCITDIDGHMPYKPSVCVEKHIRRQAIEWYHQNMGGSLFDCPHRDSVKMAHVQKNVWVVVRDGLRYRFVADSARDAYKQADRFFRMIESSAFQFVMGHVFMLPAGGHTIDVRYRKGLTDAN